MKPIRISDIGIQRKKSNKKHNNVKNNNIISPDTAQIVKECGCYGKLHAIFVTCIQCGRIACEAEKKILEINRCCLYCNENISIAGDEESSEKIPSSINDDEEMAHYVQAVDKRDRLLNYSKNTTNRMRVIDEEVDWYSEYENPWNTKEERLLALKVSNEYAENMQKRKTMININLENKKIEMDEEYEHRNNKYYSQLLDEFEARNLKKDNIVNNIKEDNVLEILRNKLNFNDKPDINIYSSNFPEQNNENILSFSEELWSGDDLY